MSDPGSRYHALLGELFEAAERGEVPAERELFARHSGQEEVVRKALADFDAYRQATERLRDRVQEEDDAASADGAVPPALPIGGLAAVLRRLEEHAPRSPRYRAGEQVGAGGMGVVYRVWDTDLRRDLAMKVAAPRDEPTRERALARFLEEAQVTGQLDHPGIVPVHELGLDEQGRLYFTMKLVKGRTLRQVLDELGRGEGGWTPTRVLGLVLKVCEAMSYAHDKGVIHRDLKPSNVMVGRYGEVYVMDWGLAKVLGRTDHGEPSTAEPAPDASATLVRSERHDLIADTPGSPIRTQDGDILGSPAYMPPEQAVGRTVDLGPATDVYAVGAMLYHLLAGHMPYVPTGERASYSEVVARLLAGPPAPLAEAAPRAPAELVAICEKAMARRAGDRYRDMTALSADLSAYLEGRVVRAYEIGAWAEARKWVRRNKALATAAAATLVALLAAVWGGASSVQAQDAERSAEEARTERASAESERAKVLGLSDVLGLQKLLEAEERGDLWPPHPERIDALESWLARARQLSANLPGHRETLAALRARSLPWTDEDEARIAAGAAERGAMSGSDAEPRLHWTFESDEDQWMHDQLAELVDGLGALGSGLLRAQLEPGRLPEQVVELTSGWSVPDRLAFARHLEQGFAEGGVYARAWDTDLADIRAAYPGLDLQPQVGLIPLGPDPDSGLWEFLHLMSGDQPRPDSEGHWRVDQDTGVVLVLLPGGETWIGAQAGDASGRHHDRQALADEGPPHQVRLSPYLIAKHELTQGQWLRLTGTNPSTYRRGGSWRDEFLADRSQPDLAHPIEQVTWEDCTTWLRRAGLVLPSEAQWEHAARGGRTTPWWTGSEAVSLAGAANVLDRYARQNGGHEWSGHEPWSDGATTHARVGSYLANPYGLHDVAGNVWEWCLDGYVEGYYLENAQVDPVAEWDPESGQRVYRGGGYTYDASMARSAARSAGAPTLRSMSIGVRPARALDPPR